MPAQALAIRPPPTCGCVVPTDRSLTRGLTGRTRAGTMHARRTCRPEGTPSMSTDQAGPAVAAPRSDKAGPRAGDPGAAGEAARAPAGTAEPPKVVRHFRQIVLWPLQLAPIRDGAQIQEHWEVLEHAGPDNPWSEVRDEFGGGPAGFHERHYSEFVTFLPYVRRFLYGDAKGRGATACESPIRVFRR